ncbi:FUSC family protein [Amycolatopsis sp. NPDC051903]|uniref:FUSC family protein n=1 Tax=Amycolatopsis sp. NPDC051903 TaxID=3363936 RepID=UPI003799E331
MRQCSTRHRRTIVPHWFTASLAFARSPVPWRDSVRSALTLPGVSAVSYAVGGPAIALYASLSALLIVLSERGGTTGQRTLRSGGGLAAGALAMVAGPLTAGGGVRPIAVVLAFGLLAGLLSCLGSGLSWAAMQLLVQMAIAGGISVDLALRDKVCAYLAGGVVALAGMWLQSAFERTDRLYARALADAVGALAGWAGSPRPAALGRSADGALGAAADLVLTARPVRPARGQRIAVYRSILGTTSVLATLLRARSTSPHIAAALGEYAAAVTNVSGPAPRAPSLPGALAGILSAPLPVARPIPVARIVAERLGDGRSWAFTAQLSLCLLAAEVLRQLTPFGHGYWIILTVALCLKPDFASVFSRTVQRGFGTAVGVVLGAVATCFSGGYWLLPILAALCGFIPWAVRRSYWAFSVLITPLVLLLLDYGGPTGPAVAVQRLVNTATGCLVVLVFGYALRPGTWFPRFERESRRLATMIERMPGGSLVDVSLQRVKVATELAALRGRARQAGSEPRALRERAAGWSAVADRLENALAERTKRVDARW